MRFVVDAEGKTVAEGDTALFGADRASGDFVHAIDFSAFVHAGADYRLVIGDDRSDAFAIGDDIYTRLRRDALSYFYHNRSGIPIEMPWAGDPRWARGAGHPGDAKVECLPALRCKGTVDASGGWYDAGDHGKYPVPAASRCGRCSTRTWATLARRLAGFARTLAIPEHDNGKPDLLDEARWELELLLRLQKSKGEWAGMLFHKLHENQWAPIPGGPHEPGEPRFLHRPSTAATLDFAAVAAQAARVYRKSCPFADAVSPRQTRMDEGPLANPYSRPASAPTSARVRDKDITASATGPRSSSSSHRKPSIARPSSSPTTSRSPTRRGSRARPAS